MRFLDTVVATLKARKAPNAAQIGDLIVQAEAEVAAARSRVAQLEAQRPDMVLEEEAKRRQYRTALAEARDDVADGEAAIASLQARHAAAAAGEEEDRRKARYKVAKIEADKLPGLIDEYAKAAEAVRAVVQKIADIDGLVAGANKDLPAGAKHLKNSGNIRAVPASPEVIVSEQAVELWVGEGRREPLSEAFQDTVIAQADGRGFRHLPSARHPEFYQKRRFIRREVRRAVSGFHATPFDKIVLPAGYAEAPPAERPIEITYEQLVELVKEAAE